MPEENDQTARIAALEADNARLRRLLDHGDAPAELRHRLRSTIALLRTIIRRTAETHRDLAGYVAHIEDRMDALMRAQAAADERGSVNLHDLFANELLHYGVAEGDRAVLSGPEIELQPRAGQVLAMAIHELVINALEHGNLDDPAAAIEVRWQVSEQGGSRLLEVHWRELGGPAMPEQTRSGFGTEVLKQMLGYELNAETMLELEDQGLRCKLGVPFTDRIGRLADA